MKTNRSRIKIPSLRLATAAVAIVALLAKAPTARAGAFTAGNLAALSADTASANNSTFSIVELSAAASNSAPVQTISINGTSGGSALRISGSAGTTGFAADSDDGTLFVFDGVNTSSSSGNASSVLPRGVGTLNSSGTFNLATTYTGVSGNQARSAVTTDDVNYLIGDQGGIYTNGATTPTTVASFRGVKSFGGKVYVCLGSASAVMVSTFSGGTTNYLPGVAANSKASDFYLISSGNNGSAFDVLYILTQNSATVGSIVKYSLVSGSWNSNSAYATTFGGLGICAATNGGGAVLYVTSGDGTVAANSLVKLTDTAGYNSPITITTANNAIIYVAAAGTTMKGIAFAPLCAAPVAHNVTGTGSYCSGGTGVIVGLDGSQTGVNYQLFGNGGATPVGAFVAGTGTAISFGAQTTADTYTVVATNTSGGCTAGMTGSATVTVSPIPSSTITVAGTVCPNSTGNTASVPSAGGGAVYGWTISGGSITAGGGTAAITFTAGASGTVTLGCGVTNSTGCGTNAISANVTISAAVVTIASNDGPYCSGATIHLFATGGAADTYSWTGPSFTSSAQNPAIPNATPANAGNYVVTRTTACGTSPASTNAVVVNAIPNSAITTSNSVCGSSTGNNASVPDAGGGAAYGWTISGGSITAGGGTAAITYTANASGTITLGCTVTNSSGCFSNASSASVTINPLPTAAITAANQALASSTGNTASVAVSAGGTYAWTITGGTITAGSGTASITYTAGASGTVVLGCTVTSSTGCGSAGSVTLPIIQPYNAGDLAVLSADTASANNSTFSIIELNPNTAGQTAVQSISINGTNGASALRISGSAGTTGFAADSDDGTLFVFDGVNTPSGTGNANTITARGVGTLNSLGGFNLATTYTGLSANQARSAVTTDDTNYIIGDQAGIYTNGATVTTKAGNFRGVKSYSGTVYVCVGSATIAAVSTFSGGTTNYLPGVAGNSKASDFCLISSGSNGPACDVLYLLTETSATAGSIIKYSLVSGSWTSNSAYATTFGGLGICASASGGGAVLYVTTGDGTVAGNNVIKLADTAGYNAASAINTANNVTLYTGAAGTTIKGIAFAPVIYPTAYSVTGGGGYCPGGGGVTVGLANSQSGMNYQLFRSGGATAVGAFVAGTGSAISFGNQTIADTYTVIATNTTGNGTATMTGSATVTVNPIPSSAISVASTVCPNSTGNTASVPNAGGGAAYGWTISGGSITAGGGTAAITYTAGASGTITLGCAVTNSSGCFSNASSASVTISDAAATTASNDGPYCPGATIHLFASGGAADTYSWTGPNFTSSAQNPTILNAAPANAGNYVVTRTTACGTSPASTNTVVVNAIPNSSITAASSVCGDSTGNTASVPSAGGGASYGWTISGGSITAGGGTAAITYVAHDSGTIILGCTVTNSSGCFSNASSASVTINPLPAAAITAANQVLANSTGNTASVAVSAGGTYAWTITGGTITAGSGTDSVTYAAGASGTVALGCTVTSSAGCGSTGSANVTIIQPFTAGNLAVLSASASANNTTASILELNSGVSNAAPVQTIAINGTSGPGALRISGSAGTTGFAADSDDDALLLFTGGNTTSSAGNANTITTRGVGALNAYGAFSLATTYTGVSGEQTRCAASADDVNFVIADQQGIYTNGATTATVTANVMTAKSFGGTVYVSSSKVAPVATYAGGATTALTGLPAVDGNLTDFYLVSSGSSGPAYDVLYILNQTNATSGAILKYSLVAGTWTANGSYATTNGGDGLCAAAGNGGAVLYMTAGIGSSAANGVFKLTDTNGYNTAIGIDTDSNVDLYTGAAGTTLKGIAFVPVVVYPAVYAVTGGGSYCPGGAGVAVGLANSRIGVNYQLFGNGGATPVGAYVAGTGGAISFGNQFTADTYTVVATNTIDNAAAVMSGNATVILIGTPVANGVTWPKNQNASFTIQVSDLLTNAGAANDTVSLTSVSSPSANGVPVGISGGQVVYGGNLTANDSFTYTVTSGTCGLTATGTVNITAVQLITGQPVSVTTNQGSSNVTFTVTATGSGLSYRWFQNGTALTDAGDIVGSTLNTLHLLRVVSTNIGSYTVVVSDSLGSVTSSVASLTLIGEPVIVTQPVNLLANQGGTAGFSVALAPGATVPVSYQWQSNRVSIPGKTLASLSLIGVTPANDGSYDVVVSNIDGRITSSTATLTVYVKPVITGQPGNTTNNIGSNITFTVTANSPSALALAYQWKHNGTPLAGATTSSYNIPALGVGDLGTYAVGVTNISALAVNLGVVSTNFVLVSNAVPVFPKALAGHTNLVGQTYLFTSMAATGAKPLAYQWYHNGSVIPGATSNAYTVKELVGGYFGILPTDAGTYSLVASNIAGFATNSALLGVNPDTNAPTVSITAPLASQNVGTNVNLFIAGGGALDNVQLTNVVYILNGVTNQATTTNAWKNWNATLTTMIPGTNILTLQAQDFSGNLSVINPLVDTKKFFFTVPSTLTIVTNGAAYGITSTNGPLELNVNQNYTITALPTSGVGVFSNWLVTPITGSATSYPLAKLTFTMRTNLTLTATFNQTPYTNGVAGTYNGLFYETNGVAFPSSGFMNVAVNSNGIYTAHLYIEGKTWSVLNGLFDANGHALATISRSLTKESNLSLDLHLNLSGSGMVTGLVSSMDDHWMSPYTGDLAVFSASNPTTNAGKYAFAYSGTTDPTLGAGGSTFGLVTVAASGAITLTGNLGDGTAEAEAVMAPIAQNGQWPVFMQRNTGEATVLGWLSFANTNALDGADVTGTLVWEKLAIATNVYYPDGFTNSSAVTGSGYTPPLIGHAILTNITTLTLSGADLPAPLVNQVTITSANKLVVTGTNPNGLTTLLITPTTGAFSGKFVNPTTGATDSFSGALLPSQNRGYGEFLSTTNSGSVLIQ